MRSITYKAVFHLRPSDSSSPWLNSVHPPVSCQESKERSLCTRVAHRSSEALWHHPPSPLWGKDRDHFREENTNPWLQGEPNPRQCRFSRESSKPRLSKLLSGTRREIVWTFQLLNSASGASEQPWTICKDMNLGFSNKTLLIKTSRGPDWACRSERANP